MREGACACVHVCVHLSVYWFACLCEYHLDVFVRKEENYSKDTRRDDSLARFRDILASASCERTMLFLEGKDEVAGCTKQKVMPERERQNEQFTPPSLAASLYFWRSAHDLAATSIGQMIKKREQAKTTKQKPGFQQGEQATLTVRIVRLPLPGGTIVAK